MRNCSLREMIGRVKRMGERYGDFVSSYRYLLLLLCGISYLSILDIPGSPAFKLTEWQQVVYLVFVSVFKGLLILTAIGGLIKMSDWLHKSQSRVSRKRWRRGIIIFITSLYGVLSLVNAISFEYYGMGISRKLILIFAQTTPDEASGFIPGLVQNLRMLPSSSGFYIALTVGLIALYVVGLLPRKGFSGTVVAMATIGLISFGIFSLHFSSGRSAHLLVVRIVKYGKEVWKSNLEYQELLKKRPALPHKETVASSHFAPTVVVVIGESAHRLHHSLYGYPLATTPNLDALSDSLIVFTDAIGSSMATSGNMERILSFKKDDMTCGDGLKYPLVIDLFNEMEYTTYWLSNQEQTGAVSNTSGVMAMNADVTNYVGADNSEDALVMKYDGALLAPFRDAISAKVPYKLIFLHLLGSHVEYRSRYPAEFDYFSPKTEKETFKFEWLDDKMAKRRAEYDNSIRYTDHILGKIIGEVMDMSTPAIFIYFSDHGEEVYDYGAYSGRNANTVQVPFVVYVNAAYASSYPQLTRCLKESKDKPLSTANLVHLLITLTGGTYELYDPESDILSTDYKLRPRYVDEEIWIHDKK